MMMMMMMMAMALHHLLLPLLLIMLFSTNFIASATDSVTTNQPLSGTTQKLVSNGGNFALGFFKPGEASYYYIGIWYNKIPKQTPVWVASRDTPITDPITSQFKISSDGNLVLSNQTNPKVWSTDANITSNSTVAVLLDTGNLVLRDGSNPNIILWQSFDHPTHTWLPGSKLGLNKVTGKTQHLTSWKSSEDPSSGIYHLELDPNGSSQYYMIWNNSKRYWTGGTWNGQTFTNVPEMGAFRSFTYKYVSNSKENYFVYYVNDESIVSRTIMDFSGQQQALIWDGQEWMLAWADPRQQCTIYSFCGPFGICNENQPYCNCVKGFSEKSDSDLSDRTGGCVRNTPLKCSQNSSAKVKEDKFWTMPNMGLPDQAQSIQAKSASACEQACLSNCSCTAYSYNSSGCSVWYGELLNLVSSGGGQTIFLRLAASDLESPKGKGIVVGAVIGSVAGCLAFLVLVWGMIRWRSRGMLGKPKVLVWGMIWWRSRGMLGKPKTVEGGLVAFRYSDLQRATKNFSEKLGRGGFGSVFKGVLADSTAVAVKKLEGLRQGEKQFRTEVSTIGTIQHVNLVRLPGFCSEGNQKLLVYEYMCNGSLDLHLFQRNTTTVEVLDWKTRYQIALGIARGLTYLHEQCRDCIIHCDIKPENVLLDAYFVPKLADFGLAKLVGRDFSRVLTTMRGTIGYLAPEWISGMAITAKADVYSYGMMLFEIISGKRNSDCKEDKTIFFPFLVGKKLVEGDVISLLDQRLEGDANLEELNRACNVACWCIQDDEDSRPSMGQVVQILEGVLEVGIPPIPRTVQLLGDRPGNMVFSSELSS